MEIPQGWWVDMDQMPTLLNVHQLVLEGLTAFVISVAAMLMFRKIAPLIQLIDLPSGHTATTGHETKKSHATHVGEVPLIGGLAIYVAVLACLVGFNSNLLNSPIAQTYLIGATVVTLTGAFDDRFDLSFKFRLVVQASTALLMYFYAGLQVTDLGDLFTMGHVGTGVIAPLFTIIVVMGAINAFNMIDGSDGVAGGTGGVTFLSLLAVPGIPNLDIPYQLGIILVAAIGGFLLFNIPAVVDHSRRCFLGDAGSTLIGFTIAFLMISLSQGPHPLSAPVTMLWLGWVPIMDMLWAITRRIISGRPIFQPDREHLHHILKRMGLNDIGVFFAMLSVNGFTGYVGLTLNQIHCPDSLSFVLWLLLGAITVMIARRTHQTLLGH